VGSVPLVAVAVERERFEHELGELAQLDLALATNPKGLQTL